MPSWRKPFGAGSVRSLSNVLVSPTVFRPFMFRVACLLAVIATLPVWGGGPTLSVGWLSDDNTSNSIRDQRDDSAVHAGITYSTFRIIDRNWQGNLTFAARTTQWQKWGGLDLSPVSAQVGVRRKFGFGPYAPRLDLTFAAGHRFAATSERTSDFAVSTLSFNQRLTPSLNWHASADLERHDAKRAVFSTTRHMFRIGVDYDATEALRLSVNVAEGRGDLISWCRVSWPEFQGKSPWFDGIFGGDWFPYQSMNRITSAQLSLAYALGRNASFAATVDLSRSAGTAKPHLYYSEILTLQFIHAF